MLLVLAAASLSLAACATQTSSNDDEGPAEDDLTANGASAKLSAQLFDDADPKKDDPVDYVLLGTVPGSAEKCLVTIGRRGMNPDKNSWSSVGIRPLGKSAATVEAHGPVDIGWAMPAGATSSRDAFSMSGDEAVYKRTSPKDPNGENQTLTLHFKAGAKHKYDSLGDAALTGKDIAGAKEASCEKLSWLINISSSAVKPTTDADFKAWEKDNGDDTEMDFEGCNVYSPQRMSCGYGNETNEEQLGLTYTIVGHKIGKMIKADRSSDFHE